MTESSKPEAQARAQPSEPPQHSTSVSAGSPWERIKEHKVLQWSLGYLGAALALAHGQELLSHTYHWPELAGRVLMGILIVGLPVVVALAWYHGHKGLKQISAGELTVVSVLVLLGAGLLIVLVREPTAPEAARAEQPAEATSVHGPTRAPAAAPIEAGISLAVLPFANMSADRDQEYFSDGLSEELLNQIAQIKGLRVVARTSSFAFKGKNEDLRIIAEKLGVNHLLEGSVRKAGNRLRITAQLINAADGSHIWSHSYDDKLDDVFTVQESIAKDVAAALSITLGVGETLRPAGGTDSIAAHDKYLRAHELSYQFDVASALKASAGYKEALALDPNFALAWLGLHTTLYNLITLAAEKPDFADYAAVARKEMAEASTHITALAPDAWWTRVMQARQFLSEREWLAADRAASSAFPAAPVSEIDPLMAYAEVLSSVGRTKEAIVLYERARRLDPLSLQVSGFLQVTLDLAGRFAEAEAEHERCKDLAGDRAIWDWWAMRRLWNRPGADLTVVEARFREYLAHPSLPMTLSETMANTLHDPPAARAAIRRALDEPANRDGDRMGLIALYAGHYGELDIAIDALRRQFIEYRITNFATIWSESENGVRTDARFKQFLRDMRLVDYWRASGTWSDYCHPIGAEDFECR